MQARMNGSKMRVAVVGGTGLAGRHVIEALQRAGADAFAVSRSTGVDVITGAGLDDALTGVRRVVDVVNTPDEDENAARDFFTVAGQRLQSASASAGVERLVVLSIVGVDRLTCGYFSAKLDHERAITAGPVPALVFRATQFHEFPGQLLEWGRMNGVWEVPDWLVQSVSVAAAARVLAHHVLDERQPVSPVEVAGPKQERLGDLAARLVARRGDRVEVRAVPDDGPDREALAGGALVPGSEATITGPSFEAWLEAGEREP